MSNKKFKSLLYFLYVLGITCPELTSPPNGNITRSDEFNYGSLVAVQCNEGYHLEGERELLCQDEDGDGEGSWNASRASCRRTN